MKLLTGISTLIIAGVVCIWIADRATLEGLVRNSPDGKYRVEIYRQLNPKPLDPYRITLREAGTDKIVRQMQIVPKNGSPDVPLRGSKNIIRWSKDSKFVEIVLDRDHACRVPIE